MQNTLGGAATYFACGALVNTPPRVMGVVGADFDLEALAFLRARGVDLAGIEVDAQGRTFRWAGRYRANLMDRETLRTELNVLETYDPIVPAAYRDSGFVFLANFHPSLQLKVLEQVRRPKLTVLDTMNFWIQTEPAAVRAVLGRCDGIIINDEEARLLSGEFHLLPAARAGLAMGPRFVIVKKGEHGAFFLDQSAYFYAPAYPLEQFADPTGAGDTFAGGLMGYIAKAGSGDAASIRRGMIYGATMASFCAFS